MTTIQVRGLGRLLLIVVTLVLALPLVAGGTYGERTAAPPAAGNSAAGTGSRAPPRWRRTLRPPGSGR
ncbi:hypothetical protein PQR15_15000 [Streptomyces lydicus]|nr:hypothetical protein [Streptomyces lydicus]